MLNSLLSNIRACQEMREQELLECPSHSSSTTEMGERKTLKPNAYFSDEDASD